MDKIRLLFICLGNICRSPAAEGVMLKMVEEASLQEKIDIDSAGIGAWHVGQHPDRRMIVHAEARGYDLSKLVARQFQAADYDRFDYIVVMDEENYHDVLSRLTPRSRLRECHAGGVNKGNRPVQKVIRMKDFFTTNAGQTTVPDPYYGGDSDFELALDLIEDGCRGLLNMLCKIE